MSDEPSRFFRSEIIKKGVLAVELPENMPQENVERIITALAKISDFFGVKLVVEDGGGGNPNTIPLASLLQEHNNNSPEARP